MAGSAEELVIRVIGDDAQYTAVMKRVQRTIEKAGGAANKFNRSVGHGTVSNTQAASAAIRLMEGDINNMVRAAENFVGRSKLLSGVLKNAFPIIGAVAITTVLIKGIDALQKYIKTAQQAPRKITDSFRGTSLSIESSTEALKIHTLETEDAINKMLGKPPQNGLKIALEEAKREADELAKSMLDVQSQIANIFKTNGVGFMKQIAGAAFTGKGQLDTRAYEGTINSYAKQLADLTYQQKQAADSGNTKLTDSLAKQAADKLAAFNMWATQTLKTLHAVNPSGRYDPSAAIAEIEGSSTVFNDKYANIAAKKADDAITRRQKQMEEQRSAAQKAKEALEKLTASIKQASSTIRTNQGEIAEASRSGMIMPHALVGLYGQPASNLQAMMSPPDRSKSNEGTQEIHRQSGFQLQWLKTLNQAGAIQSENAMAMEQVRLQIAQTTGTISAHDAAVKLASIHTEEYTEQISALYSQLDNLDALFKAHSISQNEYNARAGAIQNQMAQVNGTYRVTNAQDNQDVYSTGISGATRQALDEMVNSWMDMAHQIPGLLVNSLNELNNSLASALMVKAPTGRAYRRGITNALGQSARGIGTNLLGTSFRELEGGALKKLFGIGSKPDGTANNPIYTKSADGIAGAGKGIGSILGSLGHGMGKAGSWLGSLINAIPHFAGGGDFLANHPMLVGEKGPEIVSFGSSGHVTPNRSISGGDTNHLYIDARGSNDPAATEQAVHRAMRQYIPGIVSMSVGAVSEREKRVALHRR